MKDKRKRIESMSYGAFYFDPYTAQPIAHPYGMPYGYHFSPYMYPMMPPQHLLPSPPVIPSINNNGISFNYNYPAYPVSASNSSNSISSNDSIHETTNIDTTNILTKKPKLFQPYALESIVNDVKITIT